MSIMNHRKQSILLALLISGYISPLHALVLGQGTDTEFVFSGKFKPEAFYGKRINLFNDNEPVDEVFYFRTTIDAVTDIIYGKLSYEKPIVESRIALRTKNIWGNPNIFKDVPTGVRLIDTTIGEHNHSI